MKRRNFLKGLLAAPVALAAIKVGLAQGLLDPSLVTKTPDIDGWLLEPLTYTVTGWSPNMVYAVGDVVATTMGGGKTETYVVISAGTSGMVCSTTEDRLISGTTLCENVRNLLSAPRPSQHHLVDYSSLSMGGYHGLELELG